MKKIIIGLVAVAAMGVSARCISNSKGPEMLLENVRALSSAYCAYQPESGCYLRWLDGDKYCAPDFDKIGKDEVDEYFDYQRKIHNFYN